jgi:hypothetical protein
MSETKFWISPPISTPPTPRSSPYYKNIITVDAIVLVSGDTVSAWTKYLLDTQTENLRFLILSYFKIIMNPCSPGCRNYMHRGKSISS